MEKVSELHERARSFSAGSLRLLQSEAEWTDGTVLALIQEWAAVKRVVGDSMYAYLLEIAEAESENDQ